MINESLANANGLWKTVCTFDANYNVMYWTITRATRTVTDKHARGKLMKNINKPLPDGGVALPTSETGQRRRVGI